jgi:type 1 glutamine amidotransferase
MNPCSKLPALFSITRVVAMLAVFAAWLPREVVAAAAKPHVVFLISEDPDNYEAHRTMPAFAEELRAKQNLEVTVIKGEGKLVEFRFPRLTEVLPRADLIVVFARRLALPPEQMNALKAHLAAGKPLVGIRTANHAFAPREKITDGFVAWPEFVADVLGTENKGYGSVKDGVGVAATPAAAGHPILKGLPASWQSTSNVYNNTLLDPKATVLLTGAVPGRVEPIAWTRLYGRSRIFYTSLGHPTDFDNSPTYHLLLTNGIRWALGLAN